MGKSSMMQKIETLKEWLQQKEREGRLQKSPRRIKQDEDDNAYYDIVKRYER